MLLESYLFLRFWNEVEDGDKDRRGRREDESNYVQAVKCGYCSKNIKWQRSLMSGVDL